MFKKILVITDNEYLCKRFQDIADKIDIDEVSFTYRYSHTNDEFAKKFKDSKIFKPVNVKEDRGNIINEYDLVISLHSKQLFPKSIVSKIRCINIHPGYNPVNRGWYPQVFSILNSQALGATIHEIDEEIDNGKIIDQRKVEIFPWETSFDAYNKVIETEIELINKNIRNIVFDNYIAIEPGEKGEVNLKKDFDALCELDVEKKDSLKNFIKTLRALSHKGYRNAYYIDEKSGKKIFINISLEIDD